MHRIAINCLADKRFSGFAGKKRIGGRALFLDVRRVYSEKGEGDIFI